MVLQELRDPVVLQEWRTPLVLQEWIERPVVSQEWHALWSHKSVLYLQYDVMILLCVLVFARLWAQV